jgi:hypothetical protein
VHYVMNRFKFCDTKNKINVMVIQTALSRALFRVLMEVFPLKPFLLSSPIVADDKVSLKSRTRRARQASRQAMRTETMRQLRRSQFLPKPKTTWRRWCNYKRPPASPIVQCTIQVHTLNFIIIYNNAINLFGWLLGCLRLDRRSNLRRELWKFWRAPPPSIQGGHASSGNAKLQNHCMFHDMLDCLVVGRRLSMELLGRCFGLILGTRGNV